MVCEILCVVAGIEDTVVENRVGFRQRKSCQHCERRRKHDNRASSAKHANPVGKSHTGWKVSRDRQAAESCDRRLLERHPPGSRGISRHLSISLMSKCFSRIARTFRAFQVVLHHLTEVQSLRDKGLGRRANLPSPQPDDPLALTLEIFGQLRQLIAHLDQYVVRADFQSAPQILIDNGLQQFAGFVILL